jgi:TonB family protein
MHAHTRFTTWSILALVTSTGCVSFTPSLHPQDKPSSRDASERIESLKKVISSSADPKEQPSLLFRLGELYWEESHFLSREVRRKDDELTEAINRGDVAGESRAKAGKAELLTRQKQYGKLALEQYTKIVQSYPEFERSDEVLFFLGTYLMEDGQDLEALVAFKRLVEKYPQSKYIPDAYLAFGEYYFNNSNGKRPELEKALAAYKKAAEYPESQVYAFALYKQGWCYFNLADYPNAKDKWKAVAVLYGEPAGPAAGTDKDAPVNKKGNSLAREARTDYVRAYAREGDVMLAREDFSKVASNPKDRFAMMRTLADMYYGDGKDREAAIIYNSLIKEKPLSPEAPGFQGRIVDIVLRMGNKERTVTQVRQLVKIMKEVEGSGVIKDDKDKKALAEAKAKAERTLSNLAITWLTEAKKTREETTFGYADMISSDYLTLFPESPRAAEILKLREELHAPSSVEPGATAQTPPQPSPSEKADGQESQPDSLAKPRLGSEEVRSVIRSHASEISDCYKAARARHLEFEARVIVKFTIQGTGSVVSAEVAESNVPYEDLKSCITEHVKDWRFPEFSGGKLTVSYPFIFRLRPPPGGNQP